MKTLVGDERREYNREKLREACARRYEASPARKHQKSHPVEFCAECLAANFHRDECSHAFAQRTSEAT